MNKTQITFHGILGEQIGKSWNLRIKNVAEAIHAVNILSKRKLYNRLYENDKSNIKYQILVNDNILTTLPQGKNIDVEQIKNSELLINHDDLKTIDIVPVIVGADSQGAGIGTAIAGFALIVGGVLIGLLTGIGWAIGIPMIMAGIGLISAGVYVLISRPPEFEDFRESTGKVSYLFNGPTNVTREGGPIPVGYGRLIVGSQVISSTFEVSDEYSSEGKGSATKLHTITSSVDYGTSQVGAGN